MKNKKKKGFTLIELLAIIVILAIIAVITVPIILNIIDNSRKGAATDSAYGYKDAVNTAYVEKLATYNDLKLNGTYTVGNNGTLSGDFNDSEVTSLPITLSGTIPSSGSLTYENNVLKSGYLVIGDYRVTFNNDGTLTTEKNTGSSSNTTPLAIGTDVDYSTTLNNVTLDDWKVFLSDENYTYLIYGDYLPNAAINKNTLTGINTYGTAYSIYSFNNRETFLNQMIQDSYWDALLNGTMNGHQVNETKSDNVWAMGAPTIELWINSWNSNEGYTRIYSAQTSSQMIDGVIGYYVGTTENPSAYTVELLDENEYENQLYFPHQEIVSDYCDGYYLAAPSGNPDVYNFYHYFLRVSFLSGHGYIREEYTTDGNFAAYRPIIKLPTSVVNQ